MTERYQLIAYIATLVAIVLLVAMGVTAACLGRSIEAVGVAAAVTGLIGVIKLPTSRAPVAQTDSGDVTVSATPKS